MFADPGTPCCPRWSSNQGGRRTAATTWRIALTMTAHRHGSMLRWAVLAKIEPGVYETHACDNRRAMRRLTTIVGPTASGKTTLAVELAEQIDAEIIGADSRQVYRRMDIGTAKLTPDERTAARHHLIDVVDPDEPFSLGRPGRRSGASAFSSGAGVVGALISPPIVPAEHLNCTRRRGRMCREPRMVRFDLALRDPTDTRMRLLLLDILPQDKRPWAALAVAVLAVSYLML